VRAESCLKEMIGAEQLQRDSERDRDPARSRSGDRRRRSSPAIREPSSAGRVRVEKTRARASPLGLLLG
jgi:hypothetical protein